jgi:hypothetical protein
MDSMLKKGWRSKITTLIRNARSEAEEATREIRALLARSDLGLTLTDQIGSTVAATNIRLKDTLFAAELERNEWLKQIIEPPMASLFDKFMAWARGRREQTVKAQAEAILAYNSTYIRLKLNMPALDEAKKIEKAVRIGSLTHSDAVIELNELLSKTEQISLNAVERNIESDLAQHWFMSELGRIREDLIYLRDKFSKTISTIS